MRTDTKFQIEFTVEETCSKREDGSRGRGFLPTSDSSSETRGWYEFRRVEGFGEIIYPNDPSVSVQNRLKQKDHFIDFVVSTHYLLVLLASLFTYSLTR